jgi:diguanylate cyclase (GGDEF)-like protein
VAVSDPSNTVDSTQQLQALQCINILDTLSEERFDRYTRLATRLFGVAIALVTVVDRDRVWFKSRQGLESAEARIKDSFCGEALQSDGPLVVTDALLDARFASQAMVAGPPGVRFYAGQALHGPNGMRVGTLCILDSKPRQFPPSDRFMLANLAASVDREINQLAQGTTDRVTGLSNRKGFEEIAGHLLAHCRRLALPATLALVDIDQFMRTREAIGQQAADGLLREFSRMLHAQFRDTDVVARIGGDALCILACGIAEPALQERLLRFRAAFQDSSLQRRAGRFNWSCATVDLQAHPEADVSALVSIAYDRLRRGSAAEPARSA